MVDRTSSKQRITASCCFCFGINDSCQSVSSGNQYNGNSLYCQNNQKQIQSSFKRIIIHFRQNVFLYDHRRIDLFWLEYLSIGEIISGKWRKIYWFYNDNYWFDHARYHQIEFSFEREYNRQTFGKIQGQRASGFLSFGRAVCLGILSLQRRLVFRNADSNDACLRGRIGNSNSLFVRNWFTRVDFCVHYRFQYRKIR